MPDDIHCIVCHEASRNGGVMRLNVKGETGLWSCFEHRDLFEKGLQNTDDVLTRAAELKKRLFS